jgi:hypothetical protein
LKVFLKIELGGGRWKRKTIGRSWKAESGRLKKVEGRSVESRNGAERTKRREGGGRS